MKPYNGIPGNDIYFYAKGHRPRGVIHVGMNDGREIPWYLYIGYKSVLGFEPIPEVFIQTCLDFKEEIQAGLVRLENYALGNPSNIEILKGISLNIPRLKETLVEATMGGSALPELQLPPEYEIGRTIKVPILPFDFWADANLKDMSLYDTLVIDVQGMELEVLKGFGSYLLAIQFLVVECSEVPIFKGEVPAQIIVDYLTRRGFRQETPIGKHDDIMFVRVTK